ncbi:hypothetical protein L6164_015620 [Bauhinia variegata]|uniref:Uncharacterized protein n=1 Tax=Bauhinia variegata TaxID=167791 RepID=A0ACB9NM73_BAUVA|nr:hypothetical protein L6164_015620 [Bauhinia variegata]
MANNNDFVPYHDLYDSFSLNMFNFGDGTNPTLSEILQTGGPSSANSSLCPQQSNGNGNGNENEHEHGHLFQNTDRTIHDMGNFSINSSLRPQQSKGNGSENERGHLFQNTDPTIQAVGNISTSQGGNFEVGASEFVGKNSDPDPNEQGNSIGPVPLSIWPAPPIPFLCSCCHVLREIIHTNGANLRRLEIHGRVGIICHAIQKQSANVGSSDNSHQYQMFDFCKKSTEEIKIFLMEYCLHQISSGYLLIQDPLSNYYEALSIGLSWTDFYDDLLHNSASQSEDMEHRAEARTEDESAMERNPKTFLAAQRERVGKMKLRHLSDYFHLPIEEAAKLLNLSPTVLKKICRNEGLLRWPHRKLKVIARRIIALRESLKRQDTASKEVTLAEIARLEQEMIQLCGGMSPSPVIFEGK